MFFKNETFPNKLSRFSFKVLLPNIIFLLFLQNKKHKSFSPLILISNNNF